MLSFLVSISYSDTNSVRHNKYRIDGTEKSSPAINPAVKPGGKSEFIDVVQTETPQYLAYPGREFLYFSSDSGNSWKRIDAKVNISDAIYITAATVNPGNPDHLVIGTSYYGIFHSMDAGETWNDWDPDTKMKPLYQGAGFYNEITGLSFNSEATRIYIREGFGGKLYSSAPGAPALEPVHPENTAELFPSGGPLSRLAMSVLAPDSHWPGNFPVPPGLLEDNVLPASFNRTTQWRARRQSASNKYGIFLNAHQVSARLDEHLDFMAEQGINSVVIDYKDDQGLLRYDSNLELARRANAIRSLYSASTVIQKLHEHNIYVIARLVVFKDRALYNYDGSSYALWDRRLQEPWGVYRRSTPQASEENPEPESVVQQVEYWVDPYSEDVRNYNIDIAVELQKLGVDEIQFDYIRFPSDGKTRDIASRFLRDERGNLAHVDKNSQRVGILTKFLSEARKKLTIPIGTDVFGFNAWSRMSYLGQDIEAISNYVDVISPMSYPSHYPGNFFPEMTYLDRAKGYTRREPGAHGK